MSILPQFDIDINAVINQSMQQTTNTVAREYAWDFEKNCFILVDGKFKIVEGLEAVKVWIYKTMRTVKGRFKAYSSDYGNECEKLIGYQSIGYVKAEAERYIKEALLINSYVISISNVDVTATGKKFEISFIANTVYGEVSVVA